MCYLCNSYGSFGVAEMNRNQFKSVVWLTTYNIKENIKCYHFIFCTSTISSWGFREMRERKFLSIFLFMKKGNFCDVGLFIRYTYLCCCQRTVDSVDCQEISHRKAAPRAIKAEKRERKKREDFYGVYVAKVPSLCRNWVAAVGPAAFFLCRHSFHVWIKVPRILSGFRVLLGRIEFLVSNFRLFFTFRRM